MFKGALTALVTPFRDGAVDVPALRELVEWQIQSGIDGLVPCGSTGESATLSHAEHDSVVKITIEQARKRVPVLAGTGSNSTPKAIPLNAAAREMDYRLLPLMRALFVETNPIPIKQALAFMGKCANELRLPLVPMTAGPAERLRVAMKELRMV